MVATTAVLTTTVTSAKCDKVDDIKEPGKSRRQSCQETTRQEIVSFSLWRRGHYVIARFSSR